MRDIEQIYNYLKLSDSVATAGQPTEAQLSLIKESGYQVVVNLALSESPKALPHEQAIVESLGMHYIHIPVLWENPTIVDLASLRGRTVVYCYTLTGKPNSNLPAGWDEIPGARGCTPQSCAFRDHYQELQALGARVFGLSTQSTGYQQEAVERLHLPFELLSDAELAFTRALHLPTFEVESMLLIKRLTLIILDKQIEKVFYPVFPPNTNAEEVIEWLVQNR